MDVLPAGLLFLPDPGFFHRGGGSVPLGRGHLEEPDVADDCHRGDSADVRRTDCGLPSRFVGAGGEIKLVKCHSFNEVTGGLGFKSRQGVVTELFVRVPVPLVDRIEKVLGESQER